MEISPELEGQIENLIRAYCSESSEEPQYLKRLARQHNVLPIMVDWSAFYGLSSNGQIFVVETEDHESIEIERDDRSQRIAVFQGAKKYPCLKLLVPNRPSNAVECHHCEGRGQINLPGVEPDMIVCYCGGLGWLTEDDVLSERDS